MSGEYRCRDCGGTMTGDGYTLPLVCENHPGADGREPDAAPLYCGFKEDEMARMTTSRARELAQYAKELEDRGEDFRVVVAVPVSSLIPAGWQGWFYEGLATASNYTWGSDWTDLTLVDPFDFADVAEKLVVEYGGKSDDDARRVVAVIRAVHPAYIDLEH